jgi:hypothetical protein
MKVITSGDVNVGEWVGGCGLGVHVETTRGELHMSVVVWGGWVRACGVVL